MKANEDDGKLEKRARQVRRHWFDGLGEKEQDGVIKPAFDEEHPTGEDINRAAKDYDDSGGDND